MQIARLWELWSSYWTAKNVRAAAMQPYYDQGLTTFDMADNYGSAEVIAGRFRALQPEPEAVQLLTKWVPKLEQRSRADVRTAVQRSLDRMHMTRLDLLQYHAWSYADAIWLDHLFWLQELRDEGLIRQLGVTNFDSAHLNMALSSGIEIVSNQVCFSLLDQRASGEMTKLCANKGVKLLAYGTLACGFFSESWLGKTDPPIESLRTWSQK